MPDTRPKNKPRALDPAIPLAYIASQYLSAAVDLLTYAAGVATLVLIACIIPTVNAFDLATITVFVGLTVYVGVEFLREVSNAWEEAIPEVPYRAGLISDLSGRCRVE